MIAAREARHCLASRALSAARSTVRSRAISEKQSSARGSALSPRWAAWFQNAGVLCPIATESASRRASSFAFFVDRFLGSSHMSVSGFAAFSRHSAPRPVACE